MFGLRSARSRAVLAGVVLVLVLATVTTVAILRVRQHQDRLLALESTAASVAALEHARAQFFLETTAVSTLIYTQDPVLAERYEAAAAELRQDLSQARAEMIASGKADDLATLDRLTEQIDALESTIDTAMPILLAGDQDTVLALANTTYLQLWTSIDGAMNDLEALADAEQSELAAARVEADRAADITSWIVVAFGGGALMLATAMVVVTIVSVVRPLASLRASARTITSGDLKARAKVSGPEEVASLARGFNEMTDALSAKTQEYIDTTNLTGVLILRVDKDNRVSFVNDVMCEFLGRSREEILGTPIVDYLHPDDAPSTIQAVRRMVRSKGLVTGIVSRHVTPTGTRIMEWNGYPIFDEEGQYAGVHGTGRDITERKKTEEALRESEERLRILFEFAPDAYYLHDLEGNFVDGNRAAVELTGYKREELIGKSLLKSNLLPPEQLPEAAATVAKLVQGALAGTEEFTLIRKDGKHVAVETRGFPVEIGGQTLILGIARDISERKRAEEALRESEDRLRILFKFAPDAYYLNDLQGNFVDGNKAAEEITGYKREELIGKNMLELKLLPPEQIAKAAAALAQHAQGKPAGPNEFILNRKDGSQVPVEIRAFPVEIKGQTLVLGIARDITERKQAEEERERLHAELELRAITDSLTGLYDHAHFYQRLAEEIERSKRYNHGFALLMMDVDDFKRFNDSRGHQVGDEMLRLVAECIPAGLRRSDLAFRYGGDEFAAILPHADPAKAWAAVDRMNRRITKRLKQMDKGTAARLTLTAGVACFPDDGATSDELVRIAAATLYNAKWVARARDIMGQKEDIQSLVSALVSRQGGAEGSAGGAVFRPEALHEQQARIVSSVASSIAIALKDAGVAQAFEDPDLQVLATVGAAAEIKDRYIRGHPERMSERAVALAEEMGFSPERVRDIRIAGLLHDIGKVTVSEGILNKPGKLTRREFDIIKDHPIVGATLVSQVKGFERLAPIVRHHHERFDGTGYPDGLAGEDIPPEARILSVVDVFDALTHQRSYRNALSSAEAIAEIERGAGTQFDPAMVKAFLALVKRRGHKWAAPAQAAGEDRPLVAARAAGRRKR